MNQRTQKPIDWSQVPELRPRDPKLYELDPVLLDSEPLPSGPLFRLGTSAQQATEAFQGLQEASKDLVDLEIVIQDPPPVGREMFLVSHNPTHPAHAQVAQREPWYKCLWSWLTSSKAPISLEHVAIVDKPLTDAELQGATEQLDRVLRLPWYKRIPALILWLWRLP